MSFLFEQLTPDSRIDSAQHVALRAAASKLHIKDFCAQERWIDLDREHALYELRSEGGPGWFGGDLILFSPGHIVHFSASWPFPPLEKFRCEIAMGWESRDLVLDAAMEEVMVDAAKVYCSGKSARMACVVREFSVTFL